MAAATEERRDTLKVMLAGMDDCDKAFFKGYVNGYADGVNHMMQATSDCEEPPDALE